MGFYYIPKQNLISSGGGHMDEFWQKVYTIEKGQFVEIHEGQYGAQDNSHVQLDANGNPIYVYHWDNVIVSKDQYTAKGES
jgi:hypothetical protein